MKSFDDPVQVSKRLDTPERDEWQKPEQVVQSFALAEDATVVEIGSGTGYFAVRLARHLPKGKMIGFDDEPNMVEFLRLRAHKLGLTNLYAHLLKNGAEVELEEKVDLIFCVDTYHHIRDRATLFSNYRKHLKREGKIVVIDRHENSPEDQHAQQHHHPRVPPEKVKQEMWIAGFRLVKEMDFLPRQYYIVFEPAEHL